VRLSLLASRLRSVPLDDVRQAALELAAKPLDPARREDLESLIRLGCREIAAALQGATTDVASMQQEASRLRAALDLNTLAGAQSSPSTSA